MPTAGRALLQPYLDAVFTASPFGMVLYDADLRCVRANDRAAAYLGVHPRDLIGKEAGASLPGSTDLVQSRVRRVLATGEPLRDLESIVEPSTDAGARRAFRASYEPVLDLEAGEVVGVLAIVQDVTLQLVAQGEAADVHARADLSVRLRMQLATTPLEPRQVGTCLGQLLVENGLAQHCTVALLDDETGRFDTLAVISPNEDLQEMVTSWIDSHSFTRATPPADIVVRTRRALRLSAPSPDELADRLAEPYRPIVRALDLRAVMVAPLSAHGEMVGLLVLGRDHPFTAEDELLVQQVDGLAGIALDNARLLRRHRRYLAIVESMAGRLTLEAVYEAVLPVLREVLEVDIVRILRLSGDGSHLYSGVLIAPDDGWDMPERVAVGEGFAGKVAADQRPIVTEHASRSPLVPAALRTRLGSLAGVPITDDELLGVLVVATTRTHRFHSDDVELLQLTADRLALAMRQDETEQALQRSAEFSRIVLDHVVDGVITIDERGDVMSINPAITDMFGYAEDEIVGHNVSVLMPEPDRSNHDRHIARYLETGEPRIVGTVREVWARRKDGTELPVELGVTEVNPAGRQRFFAGVIHDVTVRRRAQEELRHQALHDPLTGLPNRVLFGDHLDEALARSVRSGAPVGLLLVDLDGFKPVNDSLGHAAGDDLLCQVAHRLKGVLRPSDTVARLGGDEFGVVVQDARRDEDVVRVARRVLEVFQKLFVVEGQAVRCTASIGVAQTAGGRESPVDLLRHADAALYQAKEAGRNRFELFDEPLRHRLQTRVRREDELSRAIERHELEPWFQPIFDLRANRIVAVEVLARWRHPVRGLLEASELVSLAEDGGLIVALGADLATQAGAARERWAAAAGGHAPDLAFNLSAQELSVAGAGDLIDRTGCPRPNLWLELTEAALMPESARQAADLAALRAQGVRIAVDGFGTGFTSIGRLGQRTADAVKIDRRFVAAYGTDRAATAVVQGTVALASTLGLDVIAVGVERLDQLEPLRRLGCTHAQGFAIAPAVVADEIPGLVRTWR